MIQFFGAHLQRWRFQSEFQTKIHKINIYLKNRFAYGLTCTQSQSTNLKNKDKEMKEGHEMYYYWNVSLDIFITYLHQYKY